MKKRKEDKKKLYPIVVEEDILSKIHNFYKGKKKNRTSDAYSMYIFCYKTARIQKNIRIWADNTFIKEGLGLSAEKVSLVKKDLKEMGLIEQIRPRERNGQFSKKSFIEVKYVWKEETIEKLFNQESQETLKYKIAKNLLMNLYSNLEPIYSQDELGLDFEIEIEIHGKREMITANYFYFDDGRLKFNTEFSQGGEFDFTVKKDKMFEWILYLAKQEQYSFDTINKILQK